MSQFSLACRFNMCNGTQTHYTPTIHHHAVKFSFPTCHIWGQGLGHIGDFVHICWWHIPAINSLMIFMMIKLHQCKSAFSAHGWLLLNVPIHVYKNNWLSCRPLKRQWKLTNTLVSMFCIEVHLNLSDKPFNFLVVKQFLKTDLKI